MKNLPSGVVHVRAGDVEIFTDSSAPNEVCRANYDVPTPVVVQVQATRRVKSNYLSPTDVHVFAGAAPGFTSDQPYEGYAALIFDYGAGAASRRVITDLRPGSYALPPCQRVSVSLFAYTANAGQFDPEFDLYVSVSPGHYATPTRPVFTVSTDAIDNGTSVDINVPNGARWVDFWTTEKEQSAASPILTLCAPTTGINSSAGQRMVKNYVDQTVFPHGGPYEIMGNTGQVQLFNDGTGVGNVVVARFFLEF